MKMFFIALSLLMLTACGQVTDKDKLAEAQRCMDEISDPKLAGSCLSHIEGMTSSHSYTLRCAIGFMVHGVSTTSNLTSIIEAAEGTMSASEMLVLMDLKTPNTTAIDLSNNCSKSSSQQLKIIGAIAMSATLVANLIPESMEITPQKMHDTITDVINGLTVNSSSSEELAGNVGGAVKGLYSTVCADPTKDKTGVCKAAGDLSPDLNIDSIPNKDIGEAILSYWNSPPAA